VTRVVATLLHPVAAADIWWRHKTDRRLDRYPANLCLLFGLIFASMSILLIGPTPSSKLTLMSTDLQMMMCACIFGGCIIKLHGVLAHSRFWFPNMPLKYCYQLGYNGAPIAAAGLFVYGFYLLEGTPNWTSALGTLLTPLLGLGVLLQGVLYWLEARRIEEVERTMIRLAKVAKGNAP
jgi:hypothetical protein